MSEITEAQSQQLVPTVNQLISNKPEELLLAELTQLRNQNLTADRAEKLKNLRIKFSKCYITMAYDFFGLSPSQLTDFDLEKRKTLGKLIFNHAKPFATTQILMAFVPLIGWLILFNCHISFNYRRLYKKLEKMCGASNYLDNEIMTKAINGDYGPVYDD